MSSPVTATPPDANRGPSVLKLSGTLDACAFVVLCLRFYTRGFIKKSTGWDDILMALGWISVTIGLAFSCLQVKNGFGRHIQYLSKPELVSVGKWTLANEIQITFSLTFIKLSACVFILRMVNSVRRPVQYTVIVLSTLLTVMAATSILVLCLQCFPLEHFYNRIEPGRCIPSEVPQRIFQAYSIIGTIIDFSYIILPALVLKDIQMNSRVKLGLIAILTLAIFPAAASIVKIVLTDYDPEDISWDLIDVEIWNILEAYFGIIIASLPTIRPLFVQLQDSLSRYATSRIALRRDRHSERSENLHTYPQGTYRFAATASRKEQNGKYKEINDDQVPLKDMSIGKRTDVVVGPEDSQGKLSV